MSEPTLPNQSLYRGVTRAMQLWADAYKDHKHVPDKHYQVFLQLERLSWEIRKDWA